MPIAGGAAWHRWSHRRLPTRFPISVASDALAWADPRHFAGFDVKNADTSVVFSSIFIRNQ